MANNINSLNILDPIYQDVIHNTKIQSECVGSAYHSSYEIAELISGSTSFTVGGEEYSLFTGSNAYENAVVCWRQTSSGGTSDYIFLEPEYTRYNHASNSVTIGLRGESSMASRHWDVVNFSGSVVSYDGYRVTIAFTRIDVIDNNDHSYSDTYNARVSMYVAVQYNITASVYGSIERIADWRDFNPTTRVNV